MITTFPVILNRKYNVLYKLGNGTFGSVYIAEVLGTPKLVAIKLESSSGDTLRHETRILNFLSCIKDPGIPDVIWYGRVNVADSSTTAIPPFLCLVLPYYEAGLMDVIEYSGTPLAILNEIMRACIRTLSKIHELGVLHRDIKPGNIMVHNRIVRIIDFGLSIVYVAENSAHIPNISGRTELIGTAKYASSFVMSGETPARRDDLISLGYVYMRATCGELPWGKISGTYSPLLSHSSNCAILEKKRSALYDSRVSPRLTAYMQICHDLEYASDPNYALLESIFNV